MATTYTGTECRVYAACLASYNAGILHGAWIDCEGLTAEEITDAIQAMLAKSPVPDAEEWAFHDFEGWGGLRISESESAEQLAEWAEVLADHDGEARLAYVDHGCSLESFEDAYRGHWDSEQDYADDYADERMAGMGIDHRLFELVDTRHGSPDLCWIASHFDYEGHARGLFHGECFSIDAPGGGVWVFDHV